MKTSKPNFPFEDPKYIDDSINTEICPSCNLSFSEHTNHEIVKCALDE